MSWQLGPREEVEKFRGDMPAGPRHEYDTGPEVVSRFHNSNGNLEVAVDQSSWAPEKVPGVDTATPIPYLGSLSPDPSSQSSPPHQNSAIPVHSEYHPHHLHPQSDEYLSSNYAAGSSAGGPPRNPGSETLMSAKPIESDSGRKRKRLLSIIGAIAAVVIAGVIGGIAGWQATEAKSRDRIAALESQLADLSNNGTAPPAATDTPSARRQIMEGSALAAVGYRYGDAFESRLFWQAPTGEVRYATYNSIAAVWSGSWTLGDSNAALLANTPLAAVVGLSSAPPSSHALPSFNAYFVNQNYEVVCRDWRAGYPPVGTIATTFTKHKKTLRDGGRISALGKQFVWQGGSDSSGYSLINSVWNKSSLVDTTFVGPGKLAARSPVLILPMTTAFREGELRVAYRTADGNLAIFERTAAGEQDEKVFPDIQLPEDAALGGFATGTSGGQLLARILFRDAAGRIQVLALDSAIGDLSDRDKWQGPSTYDVFDGADASTQIACVTAATSEEFDVKLKGTNNMNRCYFQKGGALTEVWFDGTRWRDLGNVPMRDGT